MPPRVFAAADIGSNTAHLLVAATDGSLVMRIDNYNEWIPLGEVVSKAGSIPKEITENLVDACRGFRRLADAKGAEKLYVFATEGMRMARNHETVLRKIREEAGITVEIITPSREAELSFRGVSLDSRNLPVDLLFEVGGGSCQIGRIERGRLAESESLPLGTGRIIAESGLMSPCPDYAIQAAERYIESTLERSRITGNFGLAVVSGGVGPDHHPQIDHSPQPEISHRFPIERGKRETLGNGRVANSPPPPDNVGVSRNFRARLGSIYFSSLVCS